LFFPSNLAPFSARRNQIYASGLALGFGAKFGITVNATLKTAVAMSIVIAGAIVIYEALHQDSWWYSSGLAMGWGAIVSWARNLI
jgi:hypothetical protein